MRVVASFCVTVCVRAAVLFNAFDGSGSGQLSKKELCALCQIVIFGMQPRALQGFACHDTGLMTCVLCAGSQKPSWKLASGASVGADFLKPMTDLMVEAALAEVRWVHVV
jgi:hypothetical protein